MGEYRDSVLDVLDVSMGEQRNVNEKKTYILFVIFFVKNFSY